MANEKFDGTAVSLASPNLKFDLQLLAREHTALAVRTLAEIAEKGVDERARIVAATALLDRGWGKPTQTIEQKGDVQVTINWATSDRLSYRNISAENEAQLIEAEEPVAKAPDDASAGSARVAEQVPWRELDPNSVAAAVEATKKNSGPKNPPVSEAKPVAEPAPEERPVQASGSPVQAEPPEGKGVGTIGAANAPTTPPWIIELPDRPGIKPEWINGQVWYFGDDEDGRMARAREKALEKEAKQTKAKP
jgi:hypothetical protein